MFSSLTWYDRHVLNILIATIIMLCPFIVYLHLLFDSESSKSFVIFGYTIFHGFNGMQSLTWYFLSKFVPIILLMVWFFTCNFLWRHVIIVPILIYMYSILQELAKVFTRIDILIHSFSILSLIIFLIVLIYFDKKLIELRKFELSNNFIKILHDKRLYRRIQELLQVMSITKERLGEQEYTVRMHYVKQLLKNRLGLDMVCSPMCNGRSRISRKHGIIITVLLLLFAILYFIHLIIPVGITKIKIFWFIVGNNGFIDVSTYLWFILTKLCALYLLIIWFLFSNNWWRYAIFSPIILYTYQLSEAVKNVEQLDAYGNLRAFPAVFMVVLIVLLISKFLKYRSKVFDIYFHIIKEINTSLSVLALKSYDEFDEFKKFDEIKSQIQNSNNSSAYREELLELRKKINYYIDHQP